MHHQQAQGRSGAGHAERGRGGKPAETGGGTAGVESQLAELKTRVGGLEKFSEHAEDRWQKSRTDQVEMKREIVQVKQEQKEMKGEMAELRKEQTELRKETMAGFQRVEEKLDKKLDKKLEMVRRETSMQIIQFMQQSIQQSIDRRMNRIDVSHLLMLAAILGTYFFD